MKLQHERGDKMVQQQQVRDHVLNQAVAVSVTVCVSQVVRMAKESLMSAAAITKKRLLTYFKRSSSIIVMQSVISFADPSNLNSRHCYKA